MTAPQAWWLSKTGKVAAPVTGPLTHTTTAGLFGFGAGVLPYTWTNAEAQAYWDAGVAAGATGGTDADRARIDTLYTSLKAVGLSKIPYGGLFATYHQAAGLQDLKNSGVPHLIVGGITFTAYQGFKGNGTNGYLRRNDSATWATMIGGAAVADWGALAGIYEAGGSPSYSMGLNGAGGLNNALILTGTPNVQARAGTATPVIIAAAGTYPTRIAVNRLAGGGTVELFQNETSLGTAAQAFTANNAVDAYSLLRANTVYATNRLTFAVVLLNATQANVIAISTAFETYLTAVGAG